MPWWTYKAETQTLKRTIEFKLQGAVITEENPKTTKAESYQGTAIEGVYSTTYYAAIAAVLLAIISLICSVSAAAGKASNKIAFCSVLLALVLTIFTPLYFALALPNALAQGVFPGMFSGIEYRFNGVSEAGDISWGPAIGWYLLVLACILTAIAAIATVISGKTVKERAEI
ncbi:MAG: hypothetical protein QMD21_07255 [Candidatus Thermoplasmatota archaeon]|nr:hypothetical protein [Candidatus Thermoplasmatota archaeon]